MNALVDLELLVRSRYPIIAVETWEEDRLQSTLRQIGSRQKLHVSEWSIGNPIRRLGMIAGDDSPGSQTPLEALRSVVASIASSATRPSCGGCWSWRPRWSRTGAPSSCRRRTSRCPPSSRSAPRSSASRSRASGRGR